MVIPGAGAWAGVLLALSGHAHLPESFLLGLVGLFVVSLVSNASPFFGAAYTLVAATELLVFGFSAEAFVLVVVVSAAGAAVGKLVIYAGARGFRRRLSRNRNVQLIARWAEDRRFLVAVFIAAVVPLLPLDDYIFIGAAPAGSRFLAMGSVTAAAKLVKSTFEVGVEFLGILRLTDVARHYLGLSGVDLSVILTAFFIVLGVFFFEYDWGRFFTRAEGSGVGA